MKVLVQVGDYAHLDPAAVDALVVAGNGTIVVLRSGETVTLPGMEPDEVLDAFTDALKEVTE